MSIPSQKPTHVTHVNMVFIFISLIISATSTAVPSMAESNSNSSAVIDPYQFLHIVLNPDGTLTRNLVLPTVAATCDPNFPVLSKDVTVMHQSSNTSARIFLPREALENNKKLPLVVYFHGGGFILFSVNNTVMHDYCSNLTAKAPAVFVSVEYRLAPEHRLPAAYDDAMGTLHWIRTSNDEWLTNFADLSNVFLMGISSGANIAYHAGLRAAESDSKLKPLNIRGLMLQQPFFGGVKRTRSEMELVNDASLPLPAADLMWNLSLPLGADRDHEYCNPMVHCASERLEKIKQLEWTTLVNGYEGDPLFDREVEFAKLIMVKGVRLVRQFHKGGYHGIELFDPSKATEMALTLRRIFDQFGVDHSVNSVLTETELSE